MIINNKLINGKFMAKKSKFNSVILDEILNNYTKPEYFTDLKKAVIERALEGELGYHL